MRAAVIIALSGLVLAACGSETDSTAPEAPVPAATPAPKAAGPVSMVALTDQSLASVCRAGLSVLHDQRVDAMRSEGVTNAVLTASWPAPVDGGRRFADCRVQGDVIQWRPARLPEGQASDWLTGPTDPVVRFNLDGQQIVVTQTFPDGTTSQAMLPVPVQQEAAS